MQEQFVPALERREHGQVEQAARAAVEAGH
jgi:hypothetical protein